MAIVCFCLAAQKLDLPWREERGSVSLAMSHPGGLNGTSAWGGLFLSPLGDLNLRHRREGIIVSRAHLVALRSSHPCGGKGRPEPTSL